MDEVEAKSILNAELSRLRQLTFAQLVERYLDETRAFEVKAASGAEYQIKVQAFWDHPPKPGENLRVLAAIDDGKGWRLIAPLADGFIMTPEGTFLDE